MKSWFPDASSLFLDHHRYLPSYNEHFFWWSNFFYLSEQESFHNPIYKENQNVLLFAFHMFS